jgi:DNA-binding HxlR family transcriptional regulator
MPKLDKSHDVDKSNDYDPRSSPTMSGWEGANQLARLLSARWTLAVLSELTQGGRRYQDLDDTLDGVSHKVLTDTLRRAERDGLIVRHLDPERIETATLYELTELARSLSEPLAALDVWVAANWPQVELARRRWGQRRD